jgi:hypothetical protein
MQGGGVANDRPDRGDVDSAIGHIRPGLAWTVAPFNIDILSGAKIVKMLRQMSTKTPFGGIWAHSAFSSVLPEAGAVENLSLLASSSHLTALVDHVTAVTTIDRDPRNVWRAAIGTVLVDRTRRGIQRGGDAVAVTGQLPAATLGLAAKMAVHGPKVRHGCLPLKILSFLKKWHDA